MKGMLRACTVPWWGRGRRTGVLAAVTALLAALLTGLGAAGTARAATVDTTVSYVLVNRGSGKALDVAGASTADGAGLSSSAPCVTRADCSGSPARSGSTTRSVKEPRPRSWSTR